MNILVTGSAGFIGANLVKRLFTEMTEGTIIGLDNLNSYYDVSLKEYRLQELETLNSQLSILNYQFIKGSIADKDLVNKLFAEKKFDIVVNLAAQAGVRYSIENPDAYIESNIIGFYNILEACRHHPVKHLVYASSSSVYGGNTKVPFSTDDNVDHPVSLYAATKKSNELFAHCYSKLYDIPTTGLRFFTVYGPAGRPDMAYFGFTNKLLKGETIQIYNYGNCRRDFTYVDDIVEGVVRVMKAPPKSSPKGKNLGVHTADPVMYGVLKERAEEMRRNPTEAERVLWNALKGKGLDVKFRRQHIIEDFIVDFYCNEYKVTVEVDGGYHDLPEQANSDAKRTARLNELGYTELRFTNEEVLLDLDNVLKKIRTFCSGTPSPSGEGWGKAPYAIYNIGGGQPENLLDFVQILQEELVRAGVLPKDYDFEAHEQLVPMQPGDVPTTYADATALEHDFGFVPKTTLREGLRRFAEWYKSYYI
jgi:nucleoside-diphosphate-sugar epimerase